MFWGIAIENGKKYSQTVDDSFHVSMASLEPQDTPPKNQFVSVMIEKEKTEFLLCTLQHQKLFQEKLDLNFEHGEIVTFFVIGEGVVHLTGYLLESNVMEDSDDDVGLPTLSSTDLKRKQSIDGIANQVKKMKKMSADHMDDEDDEDDSEDDADIDDEDDDSDKELLIAEDVDDISEVETDDGDEDDDDEEDDDDDTDTELMIKNVQGRKATPGKGKLGKTLNTSSESVGKNAKVSPAVSPKGKEDKTPTLVKAAKLQLALSTPSSPKSADKSKAVQMSPKSSKVEIKSEQNGKGTPTTPVNGDQGQLSKSAKKRKKKNKKLTGAVTPGAETPAKPGSDLQNKSVAADKTPAGKKVMTVDNVVIKDIVVGNGPEAKPGKMLRLYYIGKLQNNKEFDSVRKGEDPFKFRLGRGEVIKGWDIGLKGMKVGGQRKIIIPPEQGYGSKALDTIPPNSTLQFDVQLVSVS